MTHRTDTEHKSYRKTARRRLAAAVEKHAKTSLSCFCSYLSVGSSMTNANVGTCDFRCEGGAREGRARVRRGVQPAAVDNRRRDCRVTHRSLCLLAARLLTSSPWPRAPHHVSTHPTRPMTTADTVSVLQQAPGTIITRAPDEVQWACGGWATGLALLAGAVAAAARATSGTWLVSTARRRSSARCRRLLLFIARVCRRACVSAAGRESTAARGRRRVPRASPDVSWPRLHRPWHWRARRRGGRGRWPRPRKPPRESDATRRPAPRAPRRRHHALTFTKLGCWMIFDLLEPRICSEPFLSAALFRSWTPPTTGLEYVFGNDS